MPEARQSVGHHVGEVLALRAERQRLEQELQKVLRGRRQGLSTVSLPFAQACEAPF